MASHQAKISWERLRMKENNVPTQPIIENSKKIVKQFKKLENTIMASFRAKICWGRLRKRENKKKKIVAMSSYPTRNSKFPKNSKKIQKIKNQHFGNFSSQNKLGMAEKERK